MPQRKAQNQDQDDPTDIGAMANRIAQRQAQWQKTQPQTIQPQPASQATQQTGPSARSATTPALTLRGGVSDGQGNQPDDIITLKNALAWTGHYPNDSAQLLTPILDEALTWGLHRFQRDFGLKQDGITRPNGETESRLNEVITPMIQLAAMEANNGTLADDREEPDSEPSVSRPPEQSDEGDTLAEGTSDRPGWNNPFSDVIDMGRQIFDTVKDLTETPKEGAAAAQARLDELNLEIVPDDFHGPLTGNQVTRAENDRIREEVSRTHQWGVGDWANRQIVDEVIGRKASETDQRRYKDQWISDYAQTIEVMARKYGLPPEVLAGISWSEIAGDPDMQDNITVLGRNILPKTSDSKMTSGGDVSIQIRHVAKQMGLDADQLTGEQSREILLKLQGNEALNLDHVAHHVADLRDRAWPDQKGQALSEDQIERLGYMYNIGFKDELADLSKPVNREYYKENYDTEYGLDLVNKLARMKGDLDRSLGRQR